MNALSTDTPRQAADDVWLIRLPLPGPPTTVNIYLLRQQQGYLLIDCGLNTDESHDVLSKALDHLGVAWEDIRRIVVSHMHPDHYGAAGKLRELTGAPVAMHPLDACIVAPRDEDEEFFVRTETYLRENGVPPDAVQKIKAGSRKFAATLDRIVADEELTDGSLLEYAGGTLRVVHAPGHSPGLLCFYCPETKLLLSTDVMLPRITPNIGIHPFYEGNPLSDYLKSLERIEALDVGRILPAHGEPFKHHREWIAWARRHHGERCERMVEALGDARRHAYEVAGIVWNKPLSTVDRRFAMAETLAHLEYLRHQGRVERSQDSGVVLWNACS